MESVIPSVLFATYVFDRAHYLEQLSAVRSKRILKPGPMHNAAKIALQTRIRVVLVVKETREYDNLVVGTGWGVMTTTGLDYEPHSICELSIREILQGEMQLKFDTKTAARSASMLYTSSFDGKIAVIRENPKMVEMLRIIDSMSIPVRPVTITTTDIGTQTDIHTSNAGTQTDIHTSNADMQTETLETTALEQLSECGTKEQRRTTLQNLLQDYDVLKKEYRNAIKVVNQEAAEGCRKKIDAVGISYNLYFGKLLNTYIGQL